MAALNFALLCDSARIGSDRLISMLGGGWDTVMVPRDSFPVGIVLTVALRFAFEQDEVGEHRGSIVVRGPEQARLSAVNYGLTVNPAEQDDLPLGWSLNVPVVVPVPVELPTQGSTPWASQGRSGCMDMRRVVVS